MADAKGPKARLFAQNHRRGGAAASRTTASYEFGSELTGDTSMAAAKNVTYEESGQQVARTEAGLQKQ